MTQYFLYAETFARFKHKRKMSMEYFYSWMTSNKDLIKSHTKKAANISVMAAFLSFLHVN